MTSRQPSPQIALSESEILSDIRLQFPALQRQWQDKPLVYFDGPAGTQVPLRVVNAISQHLLYHNANHAGQFVTSCESDEIVDEAHVAMADLLNAHHPEEIIFGANMTTLTFHFSRALANTWRSGDEIIVTQLDHDANVRPWVLAARDAGVEVRKIPVNTSDCRLDIDAYRKLLSTKTRLVAIGCASNSVGTINPVEEMIAMAHEVGAEVFLDAVHFAPHRLIDVQAWNCDYLACSAYKFFGPHIGVLWGRGRRLLELQPYKLNPAPDELPGRWMTGTQNFACLAGTGAAVDYLADLGRNISPVDIPERRPALQAAFDWIVPYERSLINRLIDGLSNVSGIHIAGLTPQHDYSNRMPTLSLVSDKYRSIDLADALGDEGICAWHGNYYAWELSHALNREPDGMLRLGMAHYNTPDEVDRVVETIARLSKS